MPETKVCATCKKDKSCNHYTAEDCGSEMKLWESCDLPPETKRDGGQEAARWVWECLRDKLPKDINPRAIEQIDAILRYAPAPQSQDARELVRDWIVANGGLVDICAPAAQDLIDRIRLSAPAEKTVPMALIERLRYQGIHTREQIVKMFADFGFTVK